ncbi:alpha-amylase family glycosyl hydrolase [Deinococcus planocerae]|uniref:alpha-amylase family glycosyl hydrolase n=1 Tax=Deinococcus planocerae TaxID=1737569 RepID=UPI0011AFCC37|nr:alpha-amylase family glycosyl hydrolase [Deinococcus planocerae]
MTDLRLFGALYYVVIDRLRRSRPSNSSAFDHDKWYGGDFLGIILSIPHIVTMGFKTVMLSPIEKQSEGTWVGDKFYDPFHGFHPLTILRLLVEPRFGTKTMFRLLVKIFGKNRIKVFLDTVPNHRGYGTPDLESVPKCFHTEGDVRRAQEQGNPQEEFEVTPLSGLPDLRQLHPLVSAFLNRMYKKFKRWEVVGFRFDAIKHCSREWVEYITRWGPCKGVPIIGEVYDGDVWNHVPFWLLGIATTNYIWYYALVKEFSKPGNQADVDHTSGSINLTLNVVPSHGLLANFVDNHDTDRVITVCLENGVQYGDAVERVDLMLTLVYTLPGTPVVTYGTECLLEGLGLDKLGRVSNRQPMNFSPEKQTLKPRLTTLNQLRENESVVWGDYEQRYSGHGVLAFARFINGQSPVMVVVNVWDRQVELSDLPGQISVSAFASEGELRELTERPHNVSVSNDGTLRGTLPPRTALVLSPAA